MLNIVNSATGISDALDLMLPLAQQPVTTHEQFVRKQWTVSPQSTTCSPEMPEPVDCNSQLSQQAVSPLPIPSAMGNTNELGAEKEDIQAVLSAASAVMRMSHASQGRQSLAQQNAVRTVLSAASAYTARLTAKEKRCLRGKKSVGNAGHLSKATGDKHRMNGSVKSEVDNLKECSYGHKVLSKLATELEIHCGGTFSCDAFDCKSPLHFQNLSQNNPLFQELAKKTSGWSKIVKFCMLVDGHGDKECSGAPSKTMRSFSLVFNGAYTAGVQMVESPFTTMEELHLYDLQSDSDGKFNVFINKMAVELAKKASGSTKLDQKVKNIHKDLRKCVKDIKIYTQRDKIIEMWTKWERSKEGRETGEAMWVDAVLQNTLNSDKSETDDIEEEYEDPTEQ